jgi:hypothetical protein
MNVKWIVVVMCLFLCFDYSKAQTPVIDTLQLNANDSVAIKASIDTIENKSSKKIFQPDPKRAGLLSALIPGVGQAYNRQYWKTPIVWGAMGATIFMVISKQNEYQGYRKAYIQRLTEGDNSTDQYKGILSTVALSEYQSTTRQSRDMMTVYTVLIYAGQILESIAAAHLKNFDISKDIVMNISPAVLPGNTLGMALVFNFKK